MQKKQITISAGKVPGAVQELLVDEGISVLDAMTIASGKCGFTFTTKTYRNGSQEMVDVPNLNGRELCRRKGNVIEEVLWNTKLSAGDIVLIVPRIKGN